MEHQAFIELLQREGFAAPVTVEREPDGRLDAHAHPFEAKALILAGEIRIVTGGRERRYGPGDVFHLQRDEPHAESYGPQGVRYLSGRR
ncbi:cupin domain-containing protein [Massilia forsythiae]|uniref:Cupin domain-containing protein n=1 Tax=Massilia forsythiae TaxID=2728020 RepID=A0A7Z2VZD2_9BURK|nr:cupin domain-containing protein [Massilia forsythiae]QJE02221.1 cupin domain-containing protein [Massilia forsythiae]